MLITITSPVGIFNISDVKPEFKSTDNFYFKTLSNDSINDSINDFISDPITDCIWRENGARVAHHRCICSGQPVHRFFDLIS